MADYILREYENEDLPDLKCLWLDCFGDKEEYVEAFFALLPGLGSGISAAYEGSVCGCSYVLDDMQLISGDSVQSVALIYAVAVDESCRKLGIGSELVKKAVELAKKRGAETVVTLPAEDSLYGWYGKVSGFECCLHREEKLIETLDMGVVKRIGAEEYSLLREEKLKGKPHIAYGPYAMALQEKLCEIYGGGLFSCAGAIAAAYRTEGIGIMQELICPVGMDTELFAAAIGFELEVEDVKLLVPGDENLGKKYLAATGIALPKDCYWPIAFD